MVEHQQAVAAIFAADPNVQAFMSNCGARGSFARGNSGSLFVRLKPRKDRALSADQVVQELRQKAARVPGLRTFVQNPPVLRIGGMATKSTYQFTLQSPDTAELYRLAPLIEGKVRALPELVDVTTDLALNSPQVMVEINRDKATLLGVSAERIEDALYSAYGSRQISTIYAPNNDFAVILEVKPEYQRQMADLSQLYVRAANGQLIPLDSVAKMTRNLGPAAVNHLGQLPAVTISFNLRPGVALGQAVDKVQKLARENLPATVSTSFQGTAQAFQTSFKGMGLLLAVAILVIYIVLGILYESFIHPVTILTALPFAGFGALFTLLAFKTELNIYAFVGIVMLVGLVKKNGIIMIDFAIEARQKRDISAPEAIYEACLVRFRPIMMTTMAALVGTLPIALGFGAGGESRQPLGLAVVGGLLFSQMLTLFVTPVFYVYFDRLQEWLGKRRRKAVVAPA
jgi:HAE1 family hydrophobic/amphiphilic exporter-1